MHHDSYVRASASSLSMLMGSMLLAGAAHGQTLVITRGTDRAALEAPSPNFTGVARVDRLFDSLVNSDTSAGSVAFEPGARTAWHSHPGGQT